MTKNVDGMGKRGVIKETIYFRNVTKPAFIY